MLAGPEEENKVHATEMIKFYMFREVGLELMT